MLGALAEADRAELGERADRRSEALAHGMDARDERRGDRPKADEQHAELAARWGDVGRGMSHVVSPGNAKMPCSSAVRRLAGEEPHGISERAFITREQRPRPVREIARECLERAPSVLLARERRASCGTEQHESRRSVPK